VRFAIFVMNFDPQHTIALGSGAFDRARARRARDGIIQVASPW